MNIKNIFLISPIFIFINFIFSDNFLLAKDNNSIIKFFCIESVKSEHKLNDVEYQDIFGEKICNCYLANISNNIDHENSISKCKIEYK